MSKSKPCNVLKHVFITTQPYSVLFLNLSRNKRHENNIICNYMKVIFVLQNQVNLTTYVHVLLRCLSYWLNIFRYNVCFIAIVARVQFQGLNSLVLIVNRFECTEGGLKIPWSFFVNFQTTVWAFIDIYMYSICELKINKNLYLYLRIST